MTLHDPLRPGPRNDHIQALMNQYQEACKHYGLEIRPRILHRLMALGYTDVERGLEEMSWELIHLSHNYARNLLDTPEFRPLEYNWTERFAVHEEAMGRQRLEDIGALEVQRAVRSGE